MDKKYEIAISYANGNAELAEIISNELEYTFAQAFFYDRRSKDRLSLADTFKPTLRNIFRNSKYSIVLYSKEYKKAMFAPEELDEILRKAEDEKSNQFFLIKADESPMEREPLNSAYYIELILNHFKTKEEVQKQVEEIVQKNIKAVMLKSSIQNRLEENQYKLNIHTVYENENDAKWKEDYDWNILAKKYVDKRKIKEPYRWEDLWVSIRNDFKIIKEELESLKEVTRVINFNCHLSVAYKLGQIYGNLNQPSANRKLQLLSSNGKIKFNFEEIFEEIKEEGVEEDFCEEYPGNEMVGGDIIFIVSIKERKNMNVLADVKAFLERENQKYQSIYLFLQGRRINSTRELENLADCIFDRMSGARIHGRNCRFHLFLDTITPLAFVLGGRRPFSGEVQLYEYIENEATYQKSLTRGIA